MTNVINRQNKMDWLQASEAKKQLAWHLKNNQNGIFDDAIEKETRLLWSFLREAA